jgi:hypothetical protein
VTKRSTQREREAERRVWNRCVNGVMVCLSCHGPGLQFAGVKWFGDSYSIPFDPTAAQVQAGQATELLHESRSSTAPVLIVQLGCDSWRPGPLPN